MLHIIEKGDVEKLSILGNITPQETFVIFPINSEFIKFCNSSKNIPIGATYAITSSKINVFIFFI